VDIPHHLAAGDGELAYVRGESVKPRHLAVGHQDLLLGEAHLLIRLDLRGMRMPHLRLERIRAQALLHAAERRAQHGQRQRSAAGSHTVRHHIILRPVDAEIRARGRGVMEVRNAVQEHRGGRSHARDHDEVAGNVVPAGTASTVMDWAEPSLLLTLLT
jgi:hypothetical protein